MVMIATYPLYCFTDWVWDSQRRIEAGWLIVFIIVFNIVFNIALLIYQVIKLSCQKLKYKIIRNRKMKDRKQKRQEEEQKAAQKAQQ